MKDIEKLIQKEALHNTFYCKPAENAFSIALISEGTYPVTRGGVAVLVGDMMAELVPKYFNNRPVHFEIISHLAKYRTI